MHELLINLLVLYSQNELNNIEYIELMKGPGAQKHTRPGNFMVRL